MLIMTRFPCVDTGIDFKSYYIPALEIFDMVGEDLTTNLLVNLVLNQRLFKSTTKRTSKLVDIVCGESNKKSKIIINTECAIV